MEKAGWKPSSSGAKIPLSHTSNGFFLMRELRRISHPDLDS